MKLIECPRDAMQGIHSFIPTPEKIAYINALLEVGFDTLDFGSFVSPKAIPQMRDTHQVLEGLNLSATSTRLLVIVANLRGAEEACDYDEIDFLGYPLSLSETFQRRNTNRSIEEALNDLAEIQEMCEINEKGLVVYLSMGFGNPYGDPYEISYVERFISKVDGLGVSVVSLADTIGVATPALISSLFTATIPRFPHIEFGAHLHSSPHTAREKIQAAFQVGCTRIDGALKGIGGCPMAADELVGNLATETIVQVLESVGERVKLNKRAFEDSLTHAQRLFSSFS